MALNQHTSSLVDNSPPVDMDDLTGSDGGAAETDNTSDSEGDSLDPRRGSNESRSDTARIDGPGISGGTGDADSSQSGGRSQY